MVPDTFLFVESNKMMKFDGRQAFKMEKALLLKHKENTE
jgi:hypothetical protein